MEIEVVTDLEKKRWEMAVGFHSNVPYSVVRFSQPTRTGIICVGIVDSQLWIGRIWGRRVATYQTLLLMTQIARQLQCSQIVFESDKNQNPRLLQLIRRLGFVERSPGNLWESEYVLWVKEDHKHKQIPATQPIHLPKCVISG